MSNSFYLVRLPVEGGAIIIEPLSFVLRLLADLVLLSVMLGEASFLWKETWYTINLNACTLESSYKTYKYISIMIIQHYRPAMGAEGLTMGIMCTKAKRHPR